MGYSNVSNENPRIVQSITEDEFKQMLERVRANQQSASTSNYLEYIPGNEEQRGILSNSISEDDYLDPDQLEENRPLNQKKKRVFQKFTIQRRKADPSSYDFDIDGKNDINGQPVSGSSYGNPPDMLVTNTIDKDYNASNGWTVTQGIPNEMPGYRVKQEPDSVVSVKNRGMGRPAIDVEVERYTVYVDITGMMQANRPMRGGGSGLHAKRLTEVMSKVIKEEFGYYNADGELVHDAKITGKGNRNIFNMGKDAGQKGNPLYGKSGTSKTQQSGSEGFKSNFAKTRQTYFDDNAQIEHDNAYNEIYNDYSRELNEENRKHNEILDKKSEAYNKVIDISNVTRGADYVERRNDIEAIESLNDLDLPEEQKDKILNDITETFKDFYRDEKLEKFDFGYDRPTGYAQTQGQPPYNAFDAEYYKQQTLPNQSGTSVTEAERWQEALDNDDIDITERYGSPELGAEGGMSDAERGFYLWRYGQQRGPGEVRGNAAEDTDIADEYIEQTPTDAEAQAMRDDLLEVSGVTGDTEADDPVELIDSVEGIAAIWEEAKRAKEEGTDHVLLEKAGEGIDINKPGEFLLVFRQAADDGLIDENDDYNALYNELLTSEGQDGASRISAVEDAINRAVGEEAILQTQRMGIMTKNVLKDTIAEIKKAKQKEEALGIYSNFSGFGEVMDINKTLTNSILGEIGAGGFLPLKELGLSGFEKKLEKVTGVSNNVVYNWQEWFDNSIKEKYSEIEGDFLELGADPDEAAEGAANMVKIQKDFAENYVENYLTPRFDTSRSMNEFVEYLDVRDREQNPFQTQTLLNTIQNVAADRAQGFYDELNSSLSDDRKFNADYYFDPAGQYEIGEDSQFRERLNNTYKNQYDTVRSDWDTAKARPDTLIDENNPGLGTWSQAIYRYGTDVNNQESFARLHYQIKGQRLQFDPAKDFMNPLKIKSYIYDELLPVLAEKAGESTAAEAIFGQFIAPEEFAEDMLAGIDPNLPESWEEALKDPETGKSLLEDFEGSFEDMKDYIANVMRTGSAAEIRAQIKVLNERRKDPDQQTLGITYIDREEDYNPTDTLKGDTKLYTIFQNAGYEGTEDEFYENVFPDLDPGTQQLLTQVSTGDGTIDLGKMVDTSDPFAAFSSVGKLMGGDSGSILGFGKSKEERDKEERDKEKERTGNTFSLFDDDEDEDDYGYSKEGQKLLDKYTKNYQKYF